MNPENTGKKNGPQAGSRATPQTGKSAVRFAAASPTFKPESMQFPDRRRPGGSRRWKSVRSILTRALGSPFGESFALARVLAPPRLNGVSRRDGGATTAGVRPAPFHGGPPPSRRLPAMEVGEVNSHSRFWFTIQ